MNSIEGKRGESRFRPPFPPESGLFEKPTIINNVETLVNVPHIILNGSDWYRQLGTDESEGDQAVLCKRDVERPGIYEMELGCDLKELVKDLAGAERDQDGPGGGIHRQDHPRGHAQHAPGLRDDSGLRSRDGV